MKRPAGVTLIAVWHLLNGALFALGALLIVILPTPLLWLRADRAESVWPLWGLLIGVICLGAASLLGFVAGWGLLKMQDWARWLSIGLALLGLPLFPVGSLAGALIIVYLLQSPVSEAFRGDNPPELLRRARSLNS
jgi:hypothetical protein